MVDSYKLVIDLSSQKDIQRASDLLINDSLFNTKDKVIEPQLKKNYTTDWRESNLSIGCISKNKMSTEEKESVISQYLGHGIIRLFKLDNTDIGDESKCSHDDVITIPGDDTMVIILFIPTYFTVHDLLHFYIGDDIINNQISNFRILKNLDVKVGFNFSVLMKFKESIDAKKFKDTFNGKSFSKMDPEKCHVVPIKEIVFKNGLFGNNQDEEQLIIEKSEDKSNLPYLLNDPFTMNGYNSAERSKSETELPTCPVCLERMDSEATGLITIPCQHTFHCQCLDKWKNSECPVCRYSSFRLSRDSLLKQMGDSPKCATCAVKDNLWVCLVCGNVGCSRYNSKHAIQHFESTSHCFAMDIRTQRVWDYAGDNYVHRLVQNEIDGKLVEVGLNMGESKGLIIGSSENTNATEGTSSKNGDLVSNYLRNKEYHLEYVQVLISQLESQREYYEDKLNKTVEQINNKSNDEEKKLEKELEKQVAMLQRGFNHQISTVNDVQKRLSENELIVKGLQENLDKSEKLKEQSQKENETLKFEKQDLEDQVKDLMFYLETQEKFKDATEEEKNGTIIVQSGIHSSNTTSSKKPKKKNKNKKKRGPLPLLPTAD